MAFDILAIAVSCNSRAILAMVGKETHEQSLAESGSHFIAEVVDFPAAFNIRCRSFSLQMLGIVIEDLEQRRSRCLDCMMPAGRELPPANSGSREERSQRCWFHSKSTCAGQGRGEAPSGVHGHSRTVCCIMKLFNCRRCSEASDFFKADDPGVVC